IRKTFDSVTGAREVIVHFYNSTSTLQRKVVFKQDMQGIINIAVGGARLIRQLADESAGQTRVRFEYSPESFAGTEMDFAVDICARVMEELRASKNEPVILNLPSTVEMCTPNTYADQIEYFIRHLPNREAAIISVHPHNDRGTSVAAAELAVMAGAQRVEGTLFGNGERTGNLDIVTMALNLHTQGVDNKLDFSQIDTIREMYERTTRMTVPERQPYAGKLAYTAFSGSHQDAINKGYEYMRATCSPIWEIPYLPIDPADVGRAYEPVIRINSQSGKGGAAFIMGTFGYHLPKDMHPEFGNLVQAACEGKGGELSPEEIRDLFEAAYLQVDGPYKLTRYAFREESDGSGESVCHFSGQVLVSGQPVTLNGRGNGPINAACQALNDIGLRDYAFLSYHEHAISKGSDSKAIAYIQVQAPDGRKLFGVGMSSNINVASVRGILCAINRAQSAVKHQP
ncbi:MAG: 2-isopropylmalate synthase, partial [Clostridia bacterium]|nr:2-isopropylmalate synthase [Clostridia bacterium]